MATVADIEALGYTVRVAFERDGLTVYRVEGPWISTHVRSDDQEAIASLANPAAHTEAKFQHEHPDALQARYALERKGYEVNRPVPTKDEFDVVDPAQAKVVAAKKLPAELPALAETLPPIA